MWGAVDGERVGDSQGLRFAEVGDAASSPKIAVTGG